MKSLRHRQHLEWMELPSEHLRPVSSPLVAPHRTAMPGPPASTKGDCCAQSNKRLSPLLPLCGLDQSSMQSSKGSDTSDFPGLQHGDA